MGDYTIKALSDIRDVLGDYPARCGSQRTTSTPSRRR